MSATNMFYGTGDASERTSQHHDQSRLVPTIPRSRERRILLELGDSLKEDA
jgi:hypothetical protein